MEKAAMTGAVHTTEVLLPTPRPRRGKPLVWLLFTALVAVFAACTLPALVGARYITHYQVQVATLPHGSVAILDLGTQINARGMLFDHQLHFAEGAMLLDNRGSSALSEVVIDGARVSIPRGSRALVRRRPSQPIEVTSVDGPVRVRLQETAKAWGGPRNINLSAGERMSITPGKIVRSAPDLQTMKAELAWIVGMTTYRHTPLKEVVRDLNLLSDWTVKIVDPFIAEQLIDGTTVRTLQPMLDLLKSQGVDYSWEDSSAPIMLFGINSRAPNSAR